MRKHKKEFRITPARHSTVLAYDIKDIVQKNTDKYIALSTNTICSGLPDGEWNIGAGQDARRIDFYRARVDGAQMHVKVVGDRGKVLWRRRER